MNSPKSATQMMTKASVWLQTIELEQLDILRGDISRSLFIRRAIRKALAQTDNDSVPAGSTVTSQDPRAATAFEVVTATTPQEAATHQEVEV